MARPELFQMPLLVEFGGRPAEEPLGVYQGVLDDLASGRNEGSRFVRAVREEVIVHSPGDVASHLMRRIYTPFERLDQEEMWSLLLNTRNRITHEALVYRGTLSTVHVRLGELFKEAVRVNAASMILSHCHPSGDPTPSPEDVRVTEQCCEVAQLLDIALLDHIVVGDGRFVSLKERKLGFK